MSDVPSADDPSLLHVENPAASSGKVTKEPVPRRVWVVRAGQGAAYADKFLAEDLVAVGFGVNSSIAGMDWDAVVAAVKRAWADKPAVTQGLAAGVLYRVANDLHVGDFVVTPEPTGTILAGQIAGEYRFYANPIVEDYQHGRPVRWFGRLDRYKLPEGAQNGLRSLLTLFDPGFQEELLAAISPLMSGTKPGPLPTAATVTPAPTGQTLTLAQLQLNDPPVPVGSEFETDKRDLLYLLDQIDARDLALPDFQRSFVWEPGATRELIVSIGRGFPAGNLLFLRGGARVFLPRHAEEAPALNGHKPNLLILDGQQRLSSLYQAFKGVGSHRFFLDIAALARGEDVDSAIKAFSLSRARPWDSIEAQARSLMFPLSRVREYPWWKDEVLELRESLDGEERKKLRSYLNKIDEAIIQQVRKYQFPVTTLSDKTPIEAVCTIFETLNRTGIKLTVFELITARAFAQGHRLRERWQEALNAYPILGDFYVDPYYILQAIALRLGKSPQRGTVVALDVPDIVEQWDGCISGMAAALTMLRDECGVLTAKWMPYSTMLPTLAAAWHDVDVATGPQTGARRMKLQRWFWCASFAGEYENSPNSRAAADVPLLREWLTGGEAHPAVRTFDFDSKTWLETTVRQRGIYRATIALLTSRGARDFHNAQILNKATIDASSTDDHHIFPAAYLHDHGYSNIADSVLNHTLIDKITNIRIGKRGPSAYLGEIAQELGGGFAGVLASHGLPTAKDSPLMRDDYHGFLNWRRTYLKKELDRVTSDRAERDPADASATELAAAGESQRLEFKSSARYNLHTRTSDPRIEYEIVLTVAGFQNASGGTLLIGINDEGLPVDLANDYATLNHADDDRYQLWLQNLLQTRLGVMALANVSISFELVDGHKVCRIDVQPANGPVFAQPPNGPQDFFARIGNSTRKLTLAEFDDYRSSQWRNK